MAHIFFGWLCWEMEILFQQTPTGAEGTEGLLQGVGVYTSQAGVCCFHNALTSIQLFNQANPQVLSQRLLPNQGSYICATQVTTFCFLQPESLTWQAHSESLSSNVLVVSHIWSSVVSLHDYCLTHHPLCWRESRHFWKPECELKVTPLVSQYRSSAPCTDSVFSASCCPYDPGSQLLCLQNGLQYWILPSMSLPLDLSHLTSPPRVSKPIYFWRKCWLCPKIFQPPKSRGSWWVLNCICSFLCAWTQTCN